jgi:hypothetical protein
MSIRAHGAAGASSVDELFVGAELDAAVALLESLQVLLQRHQ